MASPLLVLTIRGKRILIVHDGSQNQEPDEIMDLIMPKMASVEVVPERKANGG